jgi:hypothetical protein
MTLKPIVSKSVYVNIYIYKHIFIADYDTQSIECLNIYTYIYIYIYCGLLPTISLRAYNMIPNQ